MNVFEHTFRKYNPRFDFAFVDTNEGGYGIKMSKVILEYVDELLTETETYEDMECVIMIAIMAWNSALMGDEDAHADIIDKTVPEKYSADVIELFMYLIEKKHRDYPFIDLFIVDYAITSTKTGYDLNIVSVIRP